MKALNYVVSLFIVGIVSFAALAGIDYKRDPAFNANFGFDDVVNAAIVQADGKVIIGGIYYNSNNGKPFVKRINPDGTTDPTFIVPVTSSYSGSVNKIKMLDGGKFLVFGSFDVNSVRTNYARFNADGSFDPSLPLSSVYSPQDFQADGKLLACVINSPANTYYYPVRVNTNSTIDTSFNAFVDQISCPRMMALPDGKILISAQYSPFTIGGQPAKPLYRLNPDGSQDTTFDASSLSVGSFGILISVLDDGKIMILSGGRVNRLFPDGALDMTANACYGNVAQPLADGSFFMTNCYRGGSLTQHNFVRVLSNGVVDPTFDHIQSSVNDSVGIKGIAPDGNGGYYVYGGIYQIQTGPYSYGMGHIIPETTPKRARFDFDGDNKADVAVYRQSNGYWYLNQSTAGALYLPWGGLGGDQPLAALFDNDRKTDISVFRAGTWQSYGTERGHCYSFLGQAGDKPYAGNFFASPDGERAHAVRGLRDGVVKWQVDRTGVCNPGYNQQPAAITVAGELFTDTPVIGDFTGDSRDEIGYFRDGYWYTMDHQAPSMSKSFQWGMAGDIPVPEDYDGDRETDYAVFRPSSGVWWVNLTSGGYWAIQFGMNGDVPVPADYDGDGKADIAIFRDGNWWRYLSATGTVDVVNWGMAGDVPVPAQNQY